ncbi:peroxidase family protein [uncultured Roseobacter sp.]|uniref:peroxidase family protein n=1 Tax=uncultured Roseobacter sp. TaxID=114847 RepID=UPI00260A09DD|nr:peroxidase family protein [uncultured Roseobacter sp.]
MSPTRFALTLISKISPELTTRILVWWYANTASPRPRRWSMARSYTSWTGLTDLRYTGRHLNEDPYWDERKQNGRWNGSAAEAMDKDDPLSRHNAKYGPRLTPENKEDNEILKTLFLRNNRPQQDCSRSSVLFLFFAQWFTDAFLRTDPLDHKRTDSNHEIDFCALYGLTEDKTNMLRFRKRDQNGLLKVDPDQAHLMAYKLEDGQMFPRKLYKVDPDTRKLVFDEAFQDVVEVTEEYPNAETGMRRKKVTRYLHDIDRMERITLNQSDAEKATYYAMGLEHGNGTLGYVVLNTLMLRAHNKIAEEILAAHGEEWGNDRERVFQVTRNVLTFILLKIVVEDYVAHISGLRLKTPIGMADGAPWGKSNRIALEFNLLYRWHALVPDKLHVNGKTLDADMFRRKPGLVEKPYGLETLLTEFSKQPAGRIGLRNYPDFFAMARTSGAAEGKAASKPLSTLERTLKISHDAKFQTMNAYRRHFRLKPYLSFEDLVGDQPEAQALLRDLKEMYGSIHDVEWFIGMLAEKHTNGVVMGDLMMYMVAYDAFTQALNNPLLSKQMFDPKKGGPTAVFSREGWRIIARISTLQDLSDYVLGVGKARCSFSV